MPFASAVERVPILRELAVAVAFSPSLRAAVDNDFVQQIGQEQSQNGITMRVEYVIVDQKQLNVFYTLSSEIYSSMAVDAAISSVDGTPLEGFGIAVFSGAENSGLRQVVVDFIDNDVPASLVLTCKVHGSSQSSTSELLVAHSQSVHTEPSYSTTFEFALNFDPYFTCQGEVIEINQCFILDGQRLIVASIEIYPTHARLNLEDDPENTAWLQSMEFYFENEGGAQFEPVGNGIAATGSIDSPMMQSHRLESSFFSNSRHLTLYITGIVWLDKDMGQIRLDLANVTAGALPAGVVFENAARYADGWELTFSATQRREDHSYQLFGWNYYDEAGNEHTFSGISTGRTGLDMQRDGAFFVQLHLTGYDYDTVYLSPSFSRMTTLSQPAVIVLK